MGRALIDGSVTKIKAVAKHEHRAFMPVHWDAKQLTKLGVTSDQRQLIKRPNEAG